MTTNEELPMYSEPQQQAGPSAPPEIPQDEAPSTPQQTNSGTNPLNILQVQFPNIDYATINVCFLNVSVFIKSKNI